jgi:hypothetical protein
VGTGSDREVNVRGWDLQVRKEPFGHLAIVVLTGVYQDRLDDRMPGHLSEKRRHLDEIGPCTDDTEDLHKLASHGAVKSRTNLGMAIRFESIA